MAACLGAVQFSEVSGLENLLSIQDVLVPDQMTG